LTQSCAIDVRKSSGRIDPNRTAHRAPEIRRRRALYILAPQPACVGDVVVAGERRREA